MSLKELIDITIYIFTHGIEALGLGIILFLVECFFFNI